MTEVPVVGGRGQRLLLPPTATGPGGWAGAQLIVHRARDGSMATAMLLMDARGRRARGTRLPLHYFRDRDGDLPSDTPYTVLDQALQYLFDTR